jgi:hypothetical protein
MSHDAESPMLIGVVDEITTAMSAIVPTTTLNMHDAD